MNQEDMLFGFIAPANPFTVAPFFYAKRSVSTTDTDAKQMLSTIYAPNQYKLSGLIAFIALGIVLVVIGSVLFYFHSKHKKLEALGLDFSIDQAGETHIGANHVVNTLTSYSAQYNSESLKE